MCFVSGVRLFSPFHAWINLFFIHFSLFMLSILFLKKKKWFLLCVDWKIRCFFKFISNSMRHINRGTSLLISISISLSFSLRNRFICVYLFIMRIRHQFTVLWAHTVKILLLLLSNMLCMCFFTIISLIKLNFYRDEKCVDSNFMCILLLMTRFESIKRDAEEKHNNNMQPMREKRTVRITKSNQVYLSIFLFFPLSTLSKRGHN